MMDPIGQNIQKQQAVIELLRARGLPTCMATTILERLVSDRDAVTARQAVANQEPQPVAAR
jgi:hypothetical protein